MQRREFRAGSEPCSDWAFDFAIPSHSWPRVAAGFRLQTGAPTCALPRRRGSEAAFGAWDSPCQPYSGHMHRPLYALIASFINASGRAEAIFYTSECHPPNSFDYLLLKILNSGRIASGGEIGLGECQIAVIATTLGRGRFGIHAHASVVAPCSPERWYSYARLASATSRRMTRLSLRHDKTDPAIGDKAAGSQTQDDEKGSGELWPFVRHASVDVTDPR